MKKKPPLHIKPKPRHDYQIVAADIIKRIESGEWGLGAKIPALNDLIGMYPFSRMTIFKALQQVTAGGYIESRSGVGTFVVRTRCAGTIGFVISEDVLHPQQTPMAHILSEQVRVIFDRLGYRFRQYVERCQGDHADIPDDLKEDLLNGRLRGLISACSDAALLLPRWPEWKTHAVPYVDLSGHHAARHEVVFDREAMFDIALQFCQFNRVMRIGMIGIGTGAPEEKAFYIRKAEALGLDIRESWCPAVAIEKNQFERAGFQAMQLLWANAEKPNALVVTDDIMAKGVVQAISQLGIRVPDQLAVIIQTNRDSGVFFPLPLPCIEFDLSEAAHLGAELLIDLMTTPDLPPRVLLVRPNLRLPSPVAINPLSAPAPVRG